MDTEIFQKVNDFFSKYPIRTYPKNQIIIFAEDTPEKIFYIVKGQVVTYDISYRGDEIVTNIFKSPAFFPMAYAINRNTNKYFYKTTEETKVRVAPPDEVVQFLKDNPEVTLNLLSRVYTGTEGIMGRLVHLMSGTARSRIIYEMIIECRRFGKQEADGSFLLSIHEKDLAARTGLSRETVSRELKLLKDKNLARSEKQAIRIVQLAKLETLLGKTV